jgi:hypothetical protein
MNFRLIKKSRKATTYFIKNRSCISGFSPESSVILFEPGRSSGLLMSEHLPVKKQWYVDPDIEWAKLKLPHTAYSYGDSAGFAPDFPFNGASANRVRGKSI